MKKTPIYLLIGLALLAGCGKKNGESAKALSGLTQHALDSLKTTKYFADRDIRKYLQEEFEQFYQNRAYAPAWISDDGPLPQATEMLDILDKAYQEGLQPDDYNPKEMRALAQQIFKEKAFSGDKRLSKMVELDFLMTANSLMYVSHVLSGRIDPEKLESSWVFIPRKKNLAAFLQSAIENQKMEQAIASLLPTTTFYPTLKSKLALYREMASRGGWPVVPSNQKLRLGSTGPAVATLKKRLMLSGDLDSTLSDNQMKAGMSFEDKKAATDIFDNQLVEAIKLFQGRHGLSPTGQVDPLTLAELNIPASQRLQQIELNMERLRWYPDSILGDNYVLVNVPEFKLRVIEGTKPVLEMRVIVGKEFTFTPIFSDTLEYIVFSPDWTVPNSIIENEILAKLQDNPDYLNKLDLQLYKTWNDNDTIPIDPQEVDWSTVSGAKFPYRLVQKPGLKNPLGLVKFMFPNPMFIYLHDTPSDHLFSKLERGMSHGCIRVEHPVELAEYLLSHNKNVWTKDSIEAKLHLDKPKIAKLDKKIPVQITYQTAWVDNQGMLNFRQDIYDHDKVQNKAIIRKEKAL
ncbi:MAG: L,D-transpeptidase family protein [Bacteroidota bacterium]